eukprot:jgi/Chlat1/3361/Chrsp23S03806
MMAATTTAVQWQRPHAPSPSPASDGAPWTRRRRRGRWTALLRCSACTPQTAEEEPRHSARHTLSTPTPSWPSSSLPTMAASTAAAPTRDHRCTRPLHTDNDTDPAAAAVSYFAYGANTSTRKLTGQRSIRPLSARPARAHGQRLLFDHRGGFGNLVACEDEETTACAHGVLYELLPGDWERLRRMETGYDVGQCKVTAYDETRCADARVFVSTPGSRTFRKDLVPDQRYLKLLQEGAQEHQLDAAWQGYLLLIMPLPLSRRGREYYDTLNSRVALLVMLMTPIAMLVAYTTARR